MLYPESSLIPVPPNMNTKNRPRIAVLEGDPVDVAISWSQCNGDGLIPVVNMANEDRPGGDWELGLIAPEECLARRSNLVRALPNNWKPNSKEHYPIPQNGGLYSPSVGTHRDLALSLHRLFTIAVFYRSGPEKYEVWGKAKVVPVISVAPLRWPKLDKSESRYFV